MDENRQVNPINDFGDGGKQCACSLLISRIGHHLGTDFSAIFFSLIETAKANGLKPYACFKDLFEQFPTTAEKNYPNLLPTNIDSETIGLAKK